VALGAAGAQAGHLIVYQARFGAAASQLQSTNAHAYFPGLARTGLGMTASVLLAGLFVIGLARMLNGGRSSARAAAPSYLALLAGLYTVQMACFAGQETVEAALAGAPAGSAVMLLLWGTLGQLPVAAVSAAAVRWLLAEFDSAVTEVRAALALAEPRPDVVPALVSVAASPASTMAFRPGRPSSHRKRGPPSFQRLSS
jgi:hypothetical protein